MQAELMSLNVKIINNVKYSFVSWICLMLLANGFVQSEDLKCPTCPKPHLFNDPSTCHEFVHLYNYPPGCECQYCVTRCLLRRNPCPRGTVCKMKPYFYMGMEIGKSAECVRFQRCDIGPPLLTCPQSCPNHGYFEDINGCATCHCKFPCQEHCGSPASCQPIFYGGRDASYECMN